MGFPNLRTITEWGGGLLSYNTGLVKVSLLALMYIYAIMIVMNKL